MTDQLPALSNPTRITARMRARGGLRPHRGGQVDLYEGCREEKSETLGAAERDELVRLRRENKHAGTCPAMTATGVHGSQSMRHGMSPFQPTADAAGQPAKKITRTAPAKLHSSLDSAATLVSRGQWPLRARDGRSIARRYPAKADVRPVNFASGYGCNQDMAWSPSRRPAGARNQQLSQEWLQCSSSLNSATAPGASDSHSDDICTVRLRC
jgi:hypothetical protein